ncbi:unnamed protein product [Schistosoma turkestanicum]|nr:unnamed protein product [Schistosoma turkestanicum]
MSTSLLVIGAGLPRTGTLSMKKALELIYSQPCYHGYELVTTKQHDIAKWQMLADEVSSTHNEKKMHACLSEILSGYVGVVNTHSCWLFKEMMTLYPNAKVVLTTRDKYDWLISFRQVIQPKSDDPRKKHKDDAKRRAGIPVELDILINDSLKLAFRKDDLNFDDDEMLLACYEDFFKYVQQTVPSDRLLTYRIGDGWEPLCRFLNVDIPANIPFPETNQQSDLQKLREAVNKCGSIKEAARTHPGII